MHLTVVKRVIHSGLIELEKSLGTSIYYPNTPIYIDPKQNNSNRPIGNITRCQITFEKNIDQVHAM